MKIHTDILQGSDEWLALRRKYFTASTLGDWLVADGKNKKDRDAWKNAIYRKLGEISLDEEPQKETWAMRRGKELEPVAREAYIGRTGFEVQEVGFISHDSDDFGCSPDGLVALAGFGVPSGICDESIFSHGLEIKNHVAKTHAKFLLEGGHRQEHGMQVHVSMAASGIRSWHLWLWHPELPPILEYFEWDAYTDRILERMLKLGDDFMDTKAKLHEMWKEAEQSRRNKA